MKNKQEQNLELKNAGLEKQLAAKNRELEIEAAMDRVRARTMAMQHSEELAETAFILFQQFKELGENPDQATIGIINEEEKVIEYWVTMYGSQINKVFKFSIDEPNVTHKIYKGWKAKKKSLVIDLSGKALLDFAKYRESMGGARLNKGEKRRVINVAFFSKGLINVQSNEARSEESIRLLERFAGVFDGTYTRFLDLKKAEAQAKESQIELALERVRARTMAMQKSEELREIIKVVYEQLIHLNILAEHAGFIMDYRVNNDMQIWLADKHFDPSYVAIPYFDSPHWNSFIEAKKKGMDFFANLLSFEEKNKFYRDLFDLVPGVTDEAREYYFGCPGLAGSTVLMDNVGLYIENFSGIPYTDDENNTLMRFGKVFQQTYTRFLDLQKAEAQAREAQIELSLERVRASAMAMHKTDQLLDAAELLYRELTSLGINSMAVTYAIMAGDEKNAAYYSINPVDGKLNPVPFDLSHTETEVMRVILLGWKKQEPVSKLVLDEEATLKHQTYIAGIVQAHFAENKFDQPFSVEAFLEISPKKAVIYTFNFAQGYIFIIGSEHLTKPQEEMVMRFTKVFEMTYRRFLDLKQAEEQAREAQIQLALERVRARTMAMQHSNELPETANLLFKQVQELGMPAWSAGYCNWIDDKKAITLWMSSEGVLQPPFNAPTTKDPSFIHMREAAERGETFYVEEVGGKALVKHYQYMRTLPVVGEVLDSIINAGHPLPTFQIFHLAYFAQGFLLFITYEHAPEAHDIFKRFAAVFEQTYTRFLDLQKAEEQARESQIELALERVRAKTMAMYHSEELAETASVLFEQLSELGSEPARISIGIMDQEKGLVNFWATDQEGDQINISFIAPVSEKTTISKMYAGWQAKLKSLSIELEGKELTAWVRFCRQEMGIIVKNELLQKRRVHTVGYFSQGWINYTTHALPSSETRQILERFATMFSYTYTRFLDLQKAEGQAKESQIQLALERVRARTMAMQKSEELHEVIQLVFDQLHQLNFNIDVANFTLNYRETDDLDLWLAVADAEYPMRIHLPYFDHPIFTRFNKAKGKGGLFTDTLSKPEKNSFFKHFFKYIPGVTKERQALVFGHPGLARSAVFMKNTVLTMINYQGIPFSEAENNTLLRFGQVFDQTYTRFSDLEQAEAQAREAQIQLGLERVRAKAMAMQTSEELNELIGTVFGELTKLDFVLTRCLIMIFDPETNASRWWMANSEAPAEPMNYLVQNHKNPAYDAYLKAWKERNLKWRYALKGKVKRDWDDFLFADTELAQLPGPVIAGMKAPEQVLLSASFNNFGCLTLVTLEPLSDEHSDIMLRFAKVFDMCYTRFNDLKQAEEQAREAKIEASLERVRSRTMAMQHSDELKDVIQVIYEQLHQLNFNIDSADFNLDYRDTDDFNLWVGVPGRPYPAKMHIPYIDHPLFNRIVKAKVKVPAVIADCYTSDQKNTYFRHNFKFSPTPIPAERQDFILSGAGLAISTVLMANVALSTMNYSGVPYTDADNATLMRFGKVFEQTYTRFKDLEQAEAQAREAQIQLGLERVRARAMAMQSSDELAELVDIVFKELTKLDFGLTHCAIAIADTDSAALTLWQANSEADQPPISFYRKSFDHPYPNAAYKEWKKRTPKWVYHLKGAEKKAMHDYYASSQETMYVPNAVKEGMAAYDSIILSHSFNNFGYLRTDTTNPLSENNLDVVYRFSKAFDLCYTRFTDIKQAEAQAHEAQIQLALERVRARTMAMQHSEELAETISVLFKQLLGLGIPTGQIRTCGIVTFDAKEPIGEQWITEMNGDIIPRSFMVPYNETPAYKTIYQWWKKGEEFKVNHLEGEALQEHLGYLAKYTKVPLSVLTEQSYDIYNHALFFSQGYLFIITRSAMDEYHDVFKRFGAVFQQSYTRFLDLQKAETQARESHIQLALERVRARTMAMQRSEELVETATVLFQQLYSLDVTPERVFIGIPDDRNRTIELWGTEQGGTGMSTRFEAHADEAYSMSQIFKGWEDKKTDMTVFLSGEHLDEHINYVANIMHMPVRMELVQDHRILYCTYFSKGMFVVVTPDVQSEETLSVLRRFAAVFDQTYTRFLDLQKAEAQARESQIQLGLERVRAAAMAMHDSNDVGNATALVFSELYKLGITTIRCGVCIIDGAMQQMEVWSATSSQEGKVNRGAGKLDMTAHPLWIKLWNAWKQKQSSFTYELKGKELADYYKAITNAPGYHAPDSNAVYMALGDAGKRRQFCNCFLFNEGCVFAFTQVPFSTETSQVLEKFTAVFGLTYRRYLDLTRAEAQAREAQIESALERVRSKTMAMHNSEDVAGTVATMFNELVKLGLEKTARCGISIIYDNREMELWRASYNADGKADMLIGRIDMTIHSSLTEVYQAWKNNDTVYSCELTGDNQQDYFRALNDSPTYPVQFDLTSLPVKQTNTVLFFPEGCLFAFTLEPLSEETVKLFKRFAGVFGQTYRRYLDLQKAEAQAKESQIQLALERVRARTMAMQHSEELAETATVLFQQFFALGVSPDRVFIATFSEETSEMECWTTDQEGSGVSNRFVASLKQPSFAKMLKAWKSQKQSFTLVQTGKELKDYINYLRDEIGVPFKKGVKIEQRVQNVAFFSKGLIGMTTPDVQPPGMISLIERFATVFDLAYTRFNDLKQAEAQVREAQVEAALERVRSKTMAMHNSQHVAETVAAMVDELIKLGIDKSVRSGIGIINENKQMQVLTAYAGPVADKIDLVIGHLDMTTHQMLSDAFDNWKKKKEHSTYMLTGDDQVNYYKTINNADDYSFKFDIASLPERQFQNAFYFREGYIYVFTHEQLTAEEVQIYKRFAGVFGLTYRRYLDLLNAEEQAREAQIEAALERVRSKTMAMHNSADVGETVTLMFNELIKLGVEKMARCGIAIPDDERTIELWTAKFSEGEKAEIIIGHIDTGIHPMLGSLYDAWKNKQPTFEHILKGNDLVNYITALNNSAGYPIKYDMKAWGGIQYHNDFFFAEGMVFAFTSQPLSTDTAAIFKRFSGVFGQTYRRYLDLKKAEANAREAQIEAALERVRAKAMAMRSSDDLNATANTVFIELRKLDVDLVRCGVGLLEKQTHISTIHAATNTAEGASLELLGKLNMEDHPILIGIYKHWRQNEDYFPVLEGKSLKDYYKRLREDGIPVPELKSGEKQYGYFFQFPDGCLYAWSGKQESEDTLKTLKKFTSVIGLTYTRYIELQKAESNTKEAIKQASLDRVRAEIASMRKRNDLERITPLIWDELTILGIPFIRCGVFIMDEEQELIHTFLSTPDGKAIGAFHIPFDTSGNFEKMVDSWRHGVPYIDHWKEEAFSQFADALVKQGAISSKAQYMRTLPHEGVHLNFLPFLQGMLYVGNIEPLTEDNINLIQAVADAFSTAYARYEDFNKLEAAKQQVDNTLSDLKATQTRLIQSEKMASLGELTAGIAHEIQNPLNFVNNFSEVNQEMLEELKAESTKPKAERDEQLEADLINDLIENEQKINHHGKRADAIVKGMLQHSRTGGGEKTPTNINALADEFMRLSYHGLRAKDKQFNAELVTHFDPDLPKISVIGQDIGRVLLNLFNNAFYAVNQKKKAINGDYKPEVAVATSSENGQVIIKVKDNGVGMPEHVKEKIMQPFFTTKPTGEGTGLGLSLTYDMVVKGHGGSIDVDTKENEYTLFTIKLPVQ